MIDKRPFWLLIFLFLPFHVKAMSLYTNINWDMAATVAAEETFNGASTGDPALWLGLDFEFIALELGYKKYSFEGDFTNQFGFTELEIANTVISIGGRSSIQEIFFARFGLQSHSIVTTFNNENGFEFAEAAIDGSKVGIYFGGGASFPFYLDGLFFDLGIGIEIADPEFIIMDFYLGFLYHAVEF